MGIRPFTFKLFVDDSKYALEVRKHTSRFGQKALGSEKVLVENGTIGQIQKHATRRTIIFRRMRMPLARNQTATQARSVASVPSPNPAMWHAMIQVTILPSMVGLIRRTTFIWRC